MTIKCYLLSLLLANSMVCTCSSASPKAHEGSPEASQGDPGAVIDYLAPVLHSSGKAIRLNYRSDCRGDDGVPFPHVTLQAPEKGTRGVAAIREIFEKDKNVSVTEDPYGVVTIQIGKRPPDVLQTKLSRLCLDGLQQYNPVEAFRALTSAKEMKRAMNSHRFFCVWNWASTVLEPSKGLPHLPPVLRNMTVDQAIDQIARTWAGEFIIIYGVCAEPDRSDGWTRFWLDYAGQGVYPRSLLNQK
jgi:hypothetical protein